jgi:uncharacterized protein
MSAKSQFRLPIVSEQSRSQLTRLHAAVDAMVAPLVELHGERLKCARGCHACCSDGITVFELEAVHIAHHHAELLATGVPHPEGGCAFLDSAGACRIYAHRPYVCRTQGLPLRWLEERANEVVELRDCCELNLDDAGVPLTELPADACFTLGSVEHRLREQAEQAQAGTRTPLRSLFKE